MPIPIVILRHKKILDKTGAKQPKLSQNLDQDPDLLKKALGPEKGSFNYEISYINKFGQQHFLDKIIQIEQFGKHKDQILKLLNKMQCEHITTDNSNQINDSLVSSQNFFSNYISKLYNDFFMYMNTPPNMESDFSNPKPKIEIIQRCNEDLTMFTNSAQVKLEHNKKTNYYRLNSVYCQWENSYGIMCLFKDINDEIKI